jgi:hypothetical protein
MPVHVANKIKKLQWDILCGGLDYEFKLCLVDWNVVCNPVINEELVVRK